jgi:TPR repeat protein
MNRVFRAIDRRLSAQLDLETVEDRDRREKAWDFKQTNDVELLEADPFRGEALRAAGLLETDPKMAFGLLIGMAEGGSAWCMNHVAQCYSVGCGVPADDDKALEWRRRSFEAGSTRGLLNYGHELVRRGDLEEAVRVYRVGAEQDWAPALLWLANTRLRQLGVNKTSLAEVRPLLERAAQKGSPRARHARALPGAGQAWCS